VFVLIGACAHPDAGPGPGPSPSIGKGDRDRPSREAPGRAGMTRRPRSDDNPLAGAMFYVEPSSKAATQVTQWQNQARGEDARQLSKIAAQPTARWFTGDYTRITDDVADLVSRATRAGRMPVLVAYYIPHRDCGHYSAGGAASGSAYQAWIRRVASAI